MINISTIYGRSFGNHFKAMMEILKIKGSRLVAYFGVFDLLHFIV